MIAQTKKKESMTGRKALIFALSALLLIGAAAGLWFVKTYNPTGGTAFFPPCLFHEITGLYCAGCGMTRALHYIMNGQFYQGFRMNPLAVASLPFLAWLLALVFYRLYKRRPMPKLPLWFPWVALAVILLYTVARNLPWEPFVWLAPTKLAWVRQ